MNIRINKRGRVHATQTSDGNFTLLRCGRTGFHNKVIKVPDPVTCKTCLKLEAKGK